mmetsp:Transcript_36639/g.66210  ORF Transcript_36639/g.66210 Transcript_36639/m.66210 type:complete len:411 (+) Transcript_36639:1426-2658(+)
MLDRVRGGKQARNCTQRGAAVDTADVAARGKLLLHRVQGMPPGHWAKLLDASDSLCPHRGCGVLQPQAGHICCGHVRGILQALRRLQELARLLVSLWLHCSCSCGRDATLVRGFLALVLLLKLGDVSQDAQRRAARQLVAALVEARADGGDHAWRRPESLEEVPCRFFHDALLMLQHFRCGLCGSGLHVRMPAHETLEAVGACLADGLLSVLEGSRERAPQAWPGATVHEESLERNKRLEGHLPSPVSHQLGGFFRCLLKRPSAFPELPKGHRRSPAHLPDAVFSCQCRNLQQISILVTSRQPEEDLRGCKSNLPSGITGDRSLHHFSGVHQARQRFPEIAGARRRTARRSHLAHPSGSLCAIARFNLHHQHGPDLLLSLLMILIPTAPTGHQVWLLAGHVTTWPLCSAF